MRDQMTLLGLVSSLFSVACASPAVPPVDDAPTADVAPITQPAPSAASLAGADAGVSVPFCAVGDLHGDLWAARAALRLCGAIDESDSWIAGSAQVVQVGDQLDRGPDELAVMTLLSRLQAEAAAAGGALHVLIGNHEVMNANGDLRYVTPSGFAQYASYAPGDADPAAGRRAAWAPGGPAAKAIADHPVILKLGDTVFVHAGLTAAHAKLGIDVINSASRRFFNGEAPLPAILDGEDSPVWTRHLGYDPTVAACADLRNALAVLGARRLVVGHTVQELGISSACNGQVWRVDAGISQHYGGHVSALRADQGGLRVVAP
jgi:hypothetical protein